ncbi:hypothetical protein ACFW1A_24220 [Kitasatospora sp. NPDC058965]|uniref:hypothetical protein n=1 Tax=Kitasatospora sp. NPDC058965 TaxID=3346682 RepID=UPI0036CCAD70
MTLTTEAPQLDDVDTGGPEGNARLTAATGAVLVLLLAVQGWTILSITRLVTVHVFVGLLLTAPVCLKLASTGYRFVRYYTGAPAYRRQGPPPLVKRLLGPVMVGSTLAVLATGLLLALGARQAGPVPVLLLHKVAFLGWVGATSLHVLLHLPRLAGLLGAELLPGSGRRSVPAVGRGRRWALLALVLAAGTALAFAGVHLAAAWQRG